MKSLRIVVPVIVTAIVTVLAVFSAIWLAGLVPPGEWAGLLKAGIIIFIAGATLLIIAWSAYFSYIVRTAVEKFVSR